MKISVHLSYGSVLLPSTFYGNSFYVRSEDFGKTWSKPLQIYDMTKDPVWLAKHADHNFSPLGGQTITDGLLIIDKNVILIPIERLYPKIGSPAYDQSPATSFTDRAVIRSTDNGKTWSQIAGAAPQTVQAFAHDPTGAFEFSIIVNDGVTNTQLAYSPYTGRVYMSYQAGNTKLKPDPLVAQGYPLIALNASSDLGLTWTPHVKINRTPTDIRPGAQQAFDPNIIYTADGYLAVVYYDFRNWTGGKVNLQTDAWMAIYRETFEPDGGSTGIGLDFVKEIRLTPTSFNGGIAFESSLSGIGQIIGLGLNQKNEVFTSFTITNQDTIPKFSGFRNLVTDINNRTNVFLRHVKFPLPSNR